MEKICVTELTEQLIRNCIQLTQIGEPYKYCFVNGFSLISELWNDEITIRLEDSEGYEIESQTLDYNNMTDKDLRETISYLLDCVEKELY